MAKCGHFDIRLKMAFLPFSACRRLKWEKELADMKWKVDFNEVIKYKGSKNTSKSRVSNIKGLPLTKIGPYVPDIGEWNVAKTSASGTSLFQLTALLNSF